MEETSGIKHQVHLKLIIIGDSAVGKTSIVNKFVKNIFEDSTFATITPCYLRKIITINDILYNINIWDIPGQDRNPILTHPFVKDAKGVIYTYEVNKTISCENLLNWEESLKSYQDIEEIPKIILANKSDLLENKNDYDNNLKSLKEYSEKLRCLNYYMTSAKTGNNIDDAFNFLINETIKNVKIEDIQIFNKIKKSSAGQTKVHCC